MKCLLLALMLTVSSPSMLKHTIAPPWGVLIKTVHTRDGDVKVYRDALGCSLTFRDVMMDRVDLDVCQA